MKSIGVKFESSNTTYSYLCYKDDIEVNSYVVVESPYSNSYGYSIAKVVRVDETISQKATKHIVSIVDSTAFEAQKKKELRIKELQKTLDEFVAKQQKIVLYSAFVKQNPEMEKLVNELLTLQ